MYFADTCKYHTALYSYSQETNMTDRTQFEQMLEALINEDKSTAQEIFHNIVVAKSREIYEELLENDFGQQSSDSSTPPADAGMEEEDDKDDAEDDFSADDETDDMIGDVDADSEEGDEPEGDVEDRVQDLEDALEDLKAEFEQLMAGEEGGDMPADDMGDDMAGDEFGGEEPAGDEFGMDDTIEKETSGEEEDGGTEVHHYIHTDENSFMEDDEQLIREYVEKVGGSTYNTFGSMGDNGTNTKSPVAGKNDMGGTTSNIAQGHKEVSADIGAKSNVQGNGVMGTKAAPNPDAKGNINVPGGKAGNAFTTKQPGHGAEKAGAKETATNKQSILRQAKK
jgi:hypothetical protein